jgi:hypothetical protein
VREEKGEAKEGEVWWGPRLPQGQNSLFRRHLTVAGWKAKLGRKVEVEIIEGRKQIFRS